MNRSCRPSQLLMKAFFAAAGPVGSESGSLSTSCSTLDSTDTLCNPIEPGKFGTDDDYNTSVRSSILPPAYDSIFGTGTSASNSSIAETDAAVKPDVLHEKFKPAFNKYPGRAVSVAAPTGTSTSDYTKALRYADFSTSSEQPPPYKSLLRGTGDASDLASEPDKAVATSNIITSEPTKATTVGDPDLEQYKDCDNKNDKVVVTFCSSANTICEGCNAVPGLPPPPSKHQDPSDLDSGEGMDKLKPLFSDSNNSANSGLLSNHSTDLATNQNPPGVNVSHHRERTVSSSSIASDGWGVTSELLQKHDYFKVISPSVVTPASVENSSASKGNSMIQIGK